MGPQPQQQLAPASLQGLAPSLIPLGSGALPPPGLVSNVSNPTGELPHYWEMT